MSKKGLDVWKGTGKPDQYGVRELCTVDNSEKTIAILGNR